MKWVKAIFTALATLFLGMYGGQKDKNARRYGISTLGAVIGWKRGLPLLLLIPVLVLGYGPNSWIGGFVGGNEVLIRLLYGFLLSLPFYFYGLRRGLVASVSLVLVFQVHAGSLGHIAWFGDFLIEDIVRYLTLGILMAFNLFFYSD